MAFGKRQSGAGSTAAGPSRPPVPARKYARTPSPATVAAPAAPGPDGGVTPVLSTRRGRASGSETQRRKALLHAENAASVAEDLAHFFGPNDIVYLKTYYRMVERQRLFVIGWHWPLFFSYFAWVFYRRLWALGVTLIAIPVVLEPLGFGTNAAAGGATIGLCIAMKSLYVNEGLKQILKADDLEFDGAQRMAYLMQKGGVSLLAGTVAGILYLIIVAVALIAAGREFAGAV